MPVGSLLIKFSVESHKNHLIGKFFVEPADRNYLLARFTRSVGMHQEFWWLSLQALEKYLKAALVLNGCSVKQYRHDIVDLYDKHLEVFADLAILNVSKPAWVSDNDWSGRPAREFVARANRMGHPDSRYGQRAWSNAADDLFVFDQISFGLRRLTVDLTRVLEERLLPSALKVYAGATFEQLLRAEPLVQTRAVAFRPLGLRTIGDTLQDVWFSWNGAYAQEWLAEWPPIPIQVNAPFAFENSTLEHIANELDESSPVPEPAFLEAVSWLATTVKLPDEIKKLIERHTRQVKSQGQAP